MPAAEVDRCVQILVIHDRSRAEEHYGKGREQDCVLVPRETGSFRLRLGGRLEGHYS